MKKILLVLTLTLVLIFGSLTVLADVNSSSFNGFDNGSTVSTFDDTITLNGGPWPDPNID